jgi:hypothetical protein
VRTRRGRSFSFWLPYRFTLTAFGLSGAYSTERKNGTAEKKGKKNENHRVS